MLLVTHGLRATNREASHRNSWIEASVVRIVALSLALALSSWSVRHEQRSTLEYLPTFLSTSVGFHADRKSVAVMEMMALPCREVDVDQDRLFRSMFNYPGSRRRWWPVSMKKQVTIAAYGCSICADDDVVVVESRVNLPKRPTVYDKEPCC
jgi:hypothetical protein